MLPDDYKAQIFDEIYDIVYYNTMKLKEKDPDFTPEKLESLIDTESNRQGNNWHVGGSVNEISITATIAAYQTVLSEWREGKKED